MITEWMQPTDPESPMLAPTHRIRLRLLHILQDAAIQAMRRLQHFHPNPCMIQLKRESPRTVCEKPCHGQDSKGSRVYFSRFTLGRLRSKL